MAKQKDKDTSPTSEGDKREAILAAALRVITERGLQAAPMSAIAKEAQVAAGTLYLYFESKEALVAELYKELKARMGEALLEDHVDQEAYHDQFRRFWINLYHHFVTHPLEFQFLETYSHSPAIPEAVRQESEKHYLPAITFLQKGMDLGILRQMPIVLLTQIVYQSATNAARLQIMGELSMNFTLLDIALNCVWKGISLP